jgi:hypothetical protein
LIDRQNWIAASEKTGGRRGRPICGARQAMSLSTQPLGRLLRNALPVSGSAETPACVTMRWSSTNSLCDSGREVACSCGPCKRMDSRCESSDVRVLQ